MKAGKKRAKETIGRVQGTEEDSGLRKSGKAGKRTFARPVKARNRNSLKISKKGAKREGGEKIHQESRKSPAPSAIQVGVPTRVLLTSAPSTCRCANSKSYPNGSTDDTTDTPPGGSNDGSCFSTGDACPCSGHGRSDTNHHYGSPTPATNTNMPTSATVTGSPAESPTISLMLNAPRHRRRADDAAGATPLVEPEAAPLRQRQ
jgi:hypothetical protein